MFVWSNKKGDLEANACVFCAMEIFDLCAARVYDASNIKEEISSTSDRKKGPTVAP